LRATDLARKALALWADDSGTPTVGPYGRVFTDLLTIRVEGELVALETGAAAATTSTVVCSTHFVTRSGSVRRTSGSPPS